MQLPRVRTYNLKEVTTNLEVQFDSTVYFCIVGTEPDIGKTVGTVKDDGEEQMR